MAQKVNWDQFKVKNENPRAAFEGLSYLLFCRKFGISSGLFRYQNQTAIETNPVFFEKEYIGFQTKFFDEKINAEKLKAQLSAARSKHKKLTKIVFYLNKEFTESSLPGEQLTKERKDIEAAAKKLKLKLEWVVPSNFEILLNQPQNLDLAQLYFDTADEFGFIRSGSNHKIQTFLSSREYVSLPLSSRSRSISRPVASILKSAQKTFLLVGHPGSGKSLLMHAFFREFGGLNKRTETQMVNVLIRNNAVPMIVNLKNCVNEELESILRDRQNDKKVRNRNLSFIYLLDGLDELSDERADQILTFIRDLEQQDETRKIIISCRSGNLNRLKARAYLPEMGEYKICDLDREHLKTFFVAKGTQSKIKLLTKIQKSNSPLIDEIKDILLVRLLWDTVESLDSSSVITDLLDKKIALLLSEPEHKKNIEALNLLDSKSEEIILLNQDISFRFQQKFQFRFSRSELQQIILSRYSRCDYRAVNTILNYVSNLFFESSYLDEPGPDSGPGFIYQHRRYQEYFFARQLKLEYERDPKILRELDILSNRDFFETFFLPYIRKIYERTNNVVGLLDINLLDVYLGNHRGFGVSDAYYLNSSEFIPALAAQDKLLLEELLESDVFHLKRLVQIDVQKLNQQFAKWKKDKNDYRTTDYLSSIWSVGLSTLINHIVIFWETGRRDVARTLVENFFEVNEIYKKENFLGLLDEKKREHLDSPFWKAWESYIFFNIYIQKSSVRGIFKNLIRANYSSFKNADTSRSVEESGIDKLTKSFFRALLDGNSLDLLPLIKDLNDLEFISLLGVLSDFSYLPILLGNEKMKAEVSESFRSRDLKYSKEMPFVALFKKLFGVLFSEEEIQLLEQELGTLRQERKVDWSFHNLPRRFAFICFALSKYSFESLALRKDDRIRYYDELGLYAALFRDFISILQDSKTLPESVRDYLSYVDLHDQRIGLYLKVETSFLWANIFSSSENLITFEELIILKNRLLEKGTNIVCFSFYYHLVSLNKNFFDRIVNESEIEEFEANLSEADDYQSYVNDCFSLALFYSSLNSDKARKYFIKGMKDGMLRHGWRKDDLVSYQLVDALEVLWRNNWESRPKLLEYTKEVFSLAMRVAEFTDGKGTWQGPYNVVELISKYDLELAGELKDKLKEDRGYSNFSNQVITSVLLGKVRVGKDLKEIEEGMSEYRHDYSYTDDGKERPDIYEQQLKVYVALAESHLYSAEDRKTSFEAAYALVEKMRTEELGYYLSDTYFSELKLRFIRLCEKYQKEVTVSIPEKEKLSSVEKGVDAIFLKELAKVKTKRQMVGLYKRLRNHKNHIVLKEKRTWEILVDRTYELCENIRPFIQLLEDLSYPHTDFYSSNSRFIQFGLAAALNDIRTKSEALVHLHKNTGHGGFSNMMEVYEINRDREMCRAIFRRYIQLCRFLST